MSSWLDYYNIFMYLGELHLHHCISSWLWRKADWHLPIFALYFSNSKTCRMKSGLLATHLSPQPEMLLMNGTHIAVMD